MFDEYFELLGVDSETVGNEIRFKNDADLDMISRRFNIHPEVKTGTGGPLRFGLRTKIKSLIQLYRKKCNEKASENGGK